MVRGFLTISLIVILSTKSKNISFSNHLVEHIRNPESFSERIFLNLSILNKTVSFNCDDHERIRLITRLRVELRYLRERKFKCNFQNCLNPLCSRGSGVELTYHIVLHCLIFNDTRSALLDTLNDIGCKILVSTKHKLFGSVSFNTETFLFLTQPLTISYPLKDSKSLFFRKHFSYAVI